MCKEGRLFFESKKIGKWQKKDDRKGVVDIITKSSVVDNNDTNKQWAVVVADFYGKKYVQTNEVKDLVSNNSKAFNKKK